MALPPEARAPKPKKRKVRKPAPYHPPQNFKTETVTDRRAPARKGPPSPQRTGHPVTPQPVVRKKRAAPTSTDTTSSANRSAAQKRHDRAFIDANARAARRRVLARRGRGAVVKQAKKELEGRGVLAKGLSKVAEDFDKKGVIVSTGGGPSGVALGRKATGLKTPRGVATALSPKPVRVHDTVVGRFGKDLLNLPAQALPSVYVPTAGVVEAARGRPQRIKKFAHDLAKTDPVYNTGAAAVNAVKGDSKAAKAHLKRAEKSISEHPGFAAAEFYGVKGIAGRGAGTVMRSGAVGRTAKRAASTERATRVAPGTLIAERRSYSRDVTQKAGQVAVERVKRKRASRLRRKADGGKAKPQERPVRVTRVLDGEKTYKREARKVELPTREAYIRARPKPSVRDAEPKVEELSANVRPGKPGVHIEDEYIRQIDGKTKETVGFSDRKVPGNSKVVVKRDADGKVIGALRIHFEGGKPTIAEIAVDPKHRGQGIASELVRFAHENGIDMHAVAEHADQAFTEAGAALTHKNLSRPEATSPPIKLKVRRYRYERTPQKDGEPAVPGKVSPDQADVLRHRAAELDPDRLPEREIRRQVDERMAVNEDIRRHNRSEATKRARKILKPVEKREGHAVALVAQRITKADKADLQAYVHELADKFDDLSNAGKRKNKSLRREIQKVIDDPKTDYAAIEKAAREYKAFQAPVQKKLVKAGLLADEAEKRAKLIPYAVRNMGARHEPDHWILSDTGERVSPSEVKSLMASDPTTARALYSKVEARLTDGHGNPVSDKAILAHMKANGVKPPAFITQAPNMRGARNFNVRGERAVGINGKRRTGEATLKGTHDAHPLALVEGAARTQGLVDATRSFRKTIKDFAIREPDGTNVARFKSYSQAKAEAENLMQDGKGDPIPGAHALRPVRLNPFAGRKEQLDSLIDNVDSLDKAQKNGLLSAMIEGLSAKTGEGEWALIPEAAAKRIEEHLNAQGAGAGRKVLQLGNQAFRKTVLATSPAWATGNLVEGMFRAGLVRAGPKSYLRGKAALDELKTIDAKAYQEAQSRIVGGAHFASVDQSNIRRGAEQFADTDLAPVANALGKFWRAPGPKQSAGLWNQWTNFVFNTVNGRFEHKVQTAMMGRALKDAGYKAAQDAAEGLKGTPDQIRFGREVDRMFGRYGKRSPAEKYWMTTFTPFASWALNAAYFVYRTLPRDHPVATSVTAAAVNATEEWRKARGMDLFIKGALPGFLQGSIPAKGGKHFRASRYTPFGAFGAPTETWAGQVNPMFTAALAAMKGKDWKGRDLTVKGPDGKERPADPIDRSVFAARAMFEATVPAYSVGQRVLEGGPSALNPLKPVEPKKKKVRYGTPKPGQIIGSGVPGAGKIVGPGTGGTGAGKIVP